MRYEDFEKIDAHVHVRDELPPIIDLAKEENFALLTICNHADDQAFIDRQRLSAVKMQGDHLQTLAYVTTFSMERFGEPGWIEETIQKLDEDFRQGTVGVKVWKDIGLSFTDSLGNFIQIDDDRFTPVFEFMAKNNKPLLAHIGEPRNCWLHLDSMTVNNDRDYFSKHPEFHMYLHPEYPSYQEIIAARDRMIAKNPNLKVIGAHLGSLEWSVDAIAERLDKYPNFAIDVADRICHLQLQDRQKVIDFFTKYQDRIIYATDFIVNRDSDLEKMKAFILQNWHADWKYFTTTETLTSPLIPGTFQGLGLDESIIRKLYAENAKKWYPGLF